MREGGERPTFDLGAKITKGAEWVMDRPTPRALTAIVASVLLHGAIHNREHIATAAENLTYQTVQDTRSMLREMKKEMAEDPVKRAEKDKKTIDALKNKLAERSVPDFDLTQMYFGSESLIEGVSEEEQKEATEIYQGIIDKANELKNSGASSDEVLGYILKQQGVYDEDQPLLSDLMRDHRGNCEARLKYITSAVEDLYPDTVNNGELGVQLFAPNVDAHGDIREPHVRAILTQNGNRFVLEGDAMFPEEPEMHNAPVYEVRWLTAMAFLTSRQAMDYTQVGLRPQTFIEKNSDKRPTLFTYLPSSPISYPGNAAGRDEINPQPVNGSWAGSRSHTKEYEASLIIDPISDTEVEEHTKARKALLEDEGKQKDEQLFNLLAKGGDLFSLEWSGNGLDLQNIPDKVPLSAVQAANLDKKNGISAIVLRPDQQPSVGLQEQGIGEIIFNGAPSPESLTTTDKRQIVTIKDPMEVGKSFSSKKDLQQVNIILQDKSPTEIGPIPSLPETDLTISQKAKKGEVSFVGGVPRYAHYFPAQFLEKQSFRSLHLDGIIPNGSLHLGTIKEYLKVQTLAREAKLSPISADTNFFILVAPYHALIPNLLSELTFSGEDARLVLQVKSIEPEALSGIHVKTLLIGAYFLNNSLMSDSKDTNEVEAEMATTHIKDHAFSGAQIEELDIDSTMKVTFDPLAFEGSTIKKVVITLGSKEKKRKKELEALTFPKGIEVIYTEY